MSMNVCKIVRRDVLLVLNGTSRMVTSIMTLCRASQLLLSMAQSVWEFLSSWQMLVLMELGSGVYLQMNWDCVDRGTVPGPQTVLSSAGILASSPHSLSVHDFLNSQHAACSAFPFLVFRSYPGNFFSFCPFCFPQRNKKSPRRFPSESVQWRKCGATWRCCGRCWACTVGQARPCLTRRPCR